MDLHELMDQKVDVYKENDRFNSLISYYNETGDESVIHDMWEIMFRCSCNILKRRYGKWWGWEDISDTATEMCILVMERITKRNYHITSLPRVMNYAVLSVLYSSKAMEQRKEDSNISLEWYIDEETVDVLDVYAYREWLKEECNEDVDGVYQGV